MELGPLVFEPIFMSKPWGGRALARVAGKKLPPGEPIGESWELADHPHGTSVVSEGPLQGKTLRELIESDSARVLGRKTRERFPLLVKLLDARDLLSIQVHPDDRLAKAMKLSDPGKTEAFYVLDVGPKVHMVVGLKSKNDVPRLRELAASGEIADRVKYRRPRRGEMLFCPAGGIHAIGPDMVVLEIEQNSDATFRLYDWGRAGLDGRPRELHLEEAVRAVGDGSRTVRRMKARTLRGMPFHAERLVACEQFVIDGWVVEKTVAREKANAFEILHVVKGRGQLLHTDWPPLALVRGRTYLIPACCACYEIAPRGAVEMIRAAEPATA